MGAWGIALPFLIMDDGEPVSSLRRGMSDAALIEASPSGPRETRASQYNDLKPKAHRG